MAWNPQKYNEFKTLRYKPYFDLVALIADKPKMKVIDLGCGTGELTKMLADWLTEPVIKGIDSSHEMLEKASQFCGILFEQRTIEEQLDIAERWDLIFGNASLQWVDNHKELFPKMISALNKDGQLAIQMPSQNENVLNQLLMELAKEEPYRGALGNWERDFTGLTIDEYAQILFENGGSDITIFQKVYPLIASTQDELYQFISGSALVPYFERLSGDIKNEFINEFKERIHKRFPSMPAIYAFKRIILYAKF